MKQNKTVWQTVRELWSNKVYRTCFYMFIYTVALIWFLSIYDIRSPIILQSPIVRKQVKVIEKVKVIQVTATPTKTPAKPTPTPKLKTEKQYIDTKKHAETLWRVYQIETQRGKTDYCRLTGQGFGGFGVKDGSDIVCYDTFEKAVDRAEYWLIQNGIEKNLVHGLCHYNLGGQVDDKGKEVPYMNCWYYQQFLMAKI